MSTRHKRLEKYKSLINRLSENCFAVQKPYYILIDNYNLINM